MIARSLRAAVDLTKLGDRQIVVDDAIQADGGTRTVSITGGYVALAMALKRLEKRKVVGPGVMSQAVAAVSVGIVNGKAVLDLNYSMDQKADVDMNVVMTSDGRFVEIQGTAEGEPFSRGALNAMLLLAEHGIRQLFDTQMQALAQANLTCPSPDGRGSDNLPVTACFQHAAARRALHSSRRRVADAIERDAGRQQFTLDTIIAAL